MKEKTKAFLAGLLDSEGDISISKHVSKQRTYVVKGKEYTYFGYTSYGVSLAVYNTFFPLMKYLQHHFGGEWRILRKQTKYRQTMYGWHPQNVDHALKVLEEIAPYVVLKRQQLNLCIEFLKIKTTDPLQRKYLYEKYEATKSSSVTTETNHVLSWKTNIQNAYFAGFFDGEGTAAVYNSSTIWIPNSNKNILETIKLLYNGNEVNGNERKDAKKERFIEYRVAIPVANMEKFILKVLPYSVIKREQLLLTLENLRGVSKDRKKEIQQRLFELKHPLETKIQSELISDNENALMETLEA